MRILNLGCGEGYDNGVFLGKNNVVVGVDITLLTERWAALQTTRSHFVNADGRWLPFANEAFDYVFIKDVLHHVDNHGDILEEVSRVAKRDATLCILEANRYNPVGYLHMTIGAGHDHFSQSYFRSLVEKRFEEWSMQFESFNAHVIPVKSRIVRSMFHHLVDSMGYSSIGRKFLSYNLARIMRRRQP